MSHTRQSSPEKLPHVGTPPSLPSRISTVRPDPSVPPLRPFPRFPRQPPTAALPPPHSSHAINTHGHLLLLFPAASPSPLRRPAAAPSSPSTPPPPSPPLPPLRLRHRPVQSAGMDAIPGSALFPLQRCKIVHLVRHAQGIHNVEGEKDHKAYMSEALFDAHLTPLGWRQVDNLRKHVQTSGLSKKIELVITSPLLRTMQTAVGVFGGEGYSDGINVLPLMVANAGSSERSAISSLNCPPFLAVELCREHLGVHPCDKRRTSTEYQQLFPAIDFSLIETDEDALWVSDVREPNDEVAARGMKFLDWLSTRKEKEIAVVTHSGFLYHTLKRYGNDCHSAVKDEISKHFANCELRSMVLVDRSMLGSDPAPTNYPGKIPSGADLPSDLESAENGN